MQNLKYIHNSQNGLKKQWCIAVFVPTSFCGNDTLKKAQQILQSDWSGEGIIYSQKSNNYYKLVCLLLEAGGQTWLQAYIMADAWIQKTEREREIAV